MLKPLMLTTAILIGAGSTVAATGRNRIDIDTEITIAAPVAKVWAALTDLAKYPEWNPYHVRVEGHAAPGARLRVEIHKPNGNRLTIRPHVKEVMPERSLVWGGGVAGIFKGTHRFDLEPLGPGCTRLRQSEVFSGIAIRWAELGAIEPGYRQVNAALKHRLEATSGHSC